MPVSSSPHPDTKAGAEVELRWQTGERFSVAADADGRGFELDGSRASGLSPMEALLASLGGCMGVDVVMILEKMRTEIESLRLTVRGDRAEAPPRYFHTTTLCFELRGSFTREQAERAVSLSKEKYCSVLHSLRPELRVETEIRLAD